MAASPKGRHMQLAGQWHKACLGAVAAGLGRGPRRAAGDGGGRVRGTRGLARWLWEAAAAGAAPALLAQHPCPRAGCCAGRGGHVSPGPLALGNAEHQASSPGQRVQSAKGWGDSFSPRPRGTHAMGQLFSPTLHTPDAAHTAPPFGGGCRRHAPCSPGEEGLRPGQSLLLRFLRAMVVGEAGCCSPHKGLRTTGRPLAQPLREAMEAEEHFPLHPQGLWLQGRPLPLLLCWPVEPEAHCPPRPGSLLPKEMPLPRLLGALLGPEACSAGHQLPPWQHLCPSQRVSRAPPQDTAVGLPRGS